MNPMMWGIPLLFMGIIMNICCCYIVYSIYRTFSDENQTTPKYELRKDWEETNMFALMFKIIPVGSLFSIITKSINDMLFWIIIWFFFEVIFICNLPADTITKIFNIRYMENPQ